MKDGDQILDAPIEDNRKTKTIWTGIGYVAVLYGSGIALATISYFMIGQRYIHAPGLHHLIILFTIGAGLIWLVLGLIKYLSVGGSATLKGVLAANAFTILGFMVFTYAIFHSENEPEVETDSITLSQDGDTTTLRHNGDIVYIKVGDSVLINFIDSSRLETLFDTTLMQPDPRE